MTDKALPTLSQPHIDDTDENDSSSSSDAEEKSSASLLTPNRILSSSSSVKRKFPTPENNIPVKKASSSPTSITPNRIHSSSRMKRTFSMCENSSPASLNAYNFTPIRRKSLLLEKDSWSLQTGAETPKRKSYPLEKTAQTSSHRSIYQSCVTDQTPYSPIDRRIKRLRTTLPYYNQWDLINFKSNEGFIDSHCHLDFLFERQGFKGTYADYQVKHKDTFPECYKGCLAIFCNPASFDKKKNWKSYIEEENVWASFGCHPHNAKEYNDQIEESLRKALDHPKVRALGEIGLDYSKRNNCTQKLQHEAFKRQLKIALEKKLPLVIHCREAHDDGLAIMKELVPKHHFIHLHCFTDTWELASKWIEEFPNLYIGITNVVTFPSAEQVHEVAKKIPLNRLLLETDAPYFVPRSLSRERPETRYSHPGMAIHVAAQIAALKGGIPLELVLHSTRQNTKKMYKI